MTEINDITQTLITLTVADRQVLFILLSEDGSINRLGDGSPDCKDNDFFIGVTKDRLFEKLKPLISDDMKEFLGRTYDAPDKKGRLCDFKVLFKSSNNSETGVQFLYGELSQGPPTPFRNFTIKAIELTESWFNAQKQMALKTKGNSSSLTKPWWKFW